MEFPQEGPFRLELNLEEDALLVSFGMEAERVGGGTLFSPQVLGFIGGVRYLQYWTDHDGWLYDELYFAGPLTGDALVRLQTEAASTSGRDLDRIDGLHGFAVEGMGVVVELLHAGDVGLLSTLPESQSDRYWTGTWEVVTAHPLTVMEEVFPAGTRIGLKPDISRGAVDLHFTPGESTVASRSPRTLRLGHATELWALAEPAGPSSFEELSIQMMPALDEFAPTRGAPPGVTRTRGPFAGRRLDDVLSADRRPRHRLSLALGSLRAEVLHAEEPVWAS